MRQLIADHELAMLGIPLHASPVHGQLDPKQLVEWLLADRLPVRLGLQLHKYIWGADATGV